MNEDKCVPVPESIALFFQNGSSDKVYQAQLVTNGEGGWLVNFQYGGRGKALRPGTKTKTPVDYNVAKNAYDKLVKSKMAKGYTEDGSGIAFSDTENAGRVTGYLPQLLNEVTLDDVIALFDTRVPLWLQIKHDGERRGMLGDDHTAIGANRKGLEVPLEAQIHAASIALSRQCGGELVLDTEDMGNHLAVFDVLNFKGKDLKPQGFGTRATCLARVNNEIQRHGLHQHLKVDMPGRPKTTEQIITFVDNARAANEEGVVIRTNAIYTSGRPNSGGPVLKLKFWKSATCRVRSVHDTKASIGIEVWDIVPGEAPTWVPVGNCTVPAKYGIPKIGDLVEIKYLYAYKGGSLFEPSFKGYRKDLT